MGMGTPLLCLRTTTYTLEKTWQAWFEEPDKKKRKKLEQNFEHLLAEVHTFLGYVEEEWRTAFKKPKKLKYDCGIQHSLVDNFVPSWERQKRKKKA